MAAIQTLVYRLILAISTLPSAQDWLFSATILLSLTIIALPIGFYLGFLEVDILKVSRLRIATIIGWSFFFPAVSEEVFFRVLLLPHPSKNASISAQWIWGCISLIVFIVYHPLNAVTFFPAGCPTFFHPVFLLLAALLGIICTISYLYSGSLWLPVAIHWLVVAVWLVLLGGYAKLNSEYIKN